MASNIDEAGVRFVVEGLTAYLAEISAANKATAGIGTNADAAAVKSGVAWGKIASAARVGALAVAAAAVGIGIALLKIAGDFDDATDAIAVGTGATGEDLADLQTSFDKVFSSIPADGGAIAKAMVAISQKTGATGPALETLTTQIVELSRITGTDLNANIEAVLGATQRWGLSASAAAPFLDELFRISQESGVPVAELAASLQANKAILDGLGMSLPTSAKLIGALGKAGIDADTAFGGLRIALTKMAKEGVKDPQAALEKYFKQIKDAKTDAEASAIGVQIFGRSAITLTGAIRDGSFSLETFTEGLEDNKRGILDAAEATNDWQEDLTILKNRALLELRPVAERVFRAVGDAVVAVQPHLDAFLKWFRTDIEPPVRDIIRLFENDVAPALRSIARVAETVLQPLVKAVFENIGGYIKGVVDVITGTIELINALLHGRWQEAWTALQKVATGAFDIIAAWPKSMFRLLNTYFGEGFRDLMSRLVEWLDTYVLGPFRALGGFAAAGAAYITDLTGAVRDKLTSTVETVRGWVDTYILRPFQGIVGIGKAGTQLVTDFTSAIFTAIGGALERVGGWAKGIGAAIYNGAKDGLGDLGSAIWEWIKGAINGAIGALEDGINGVISAVNRAVEFSFGFSVLGKDFEISVDPPDIGSISLPRVGGSAGSGASARGQGSGASVTSSGGAEFAGGVAGADVLNRLVDVLGRIASALPSIAQGAATQPGGSSFVVNATYANPQQPASIRLDLLEISMRGAS